MEQTDRQTDRASHWNSAIFDKADNWERIKNPPAGFKVHTKKEICPTTGKEHYQTHVECGKQVRLSNMTKWIQTHWTPIRGDVYIKNSINYISKLETTAPGAKVEVITGDKYYQFHEILYAIACHANEGYVMLCPRTQRMSIDWEVLTPRLVEKDLKWANRLSNPALKKAWDQWRMCFLDAAAEGSSFIIEEEPDLFIPGEEFGLFQEI